MHVFKKPLADFSATTLKQFCGESFFASHGFVNLWASKGGHAVAWCLQDGDTLAAILPGVEFGRLFYKRFMSMPDGCYGGVFCLPEYIPEKPVLVREFFDAVLAAGYARTFIFDFNNALDQDSRFELLPLETTLVDISQSDWLPPDRKIQAQIRKAPREGIVVEAMDWSRHGDRFMDLMNLTEKRHHRKPVFSRKFFQDLYDVSVHDDRLHWVWCEHEGQGACSHIYIVENGVLQGWQVYFDKKFSFLKPNQYIRFITCRDMAARGIKWLNLGGTPENAPGLSYYKNRWGGDTHKYVGLVHRRGLGRLR